MEAAAPTMNDPFTNYPLKDIRHPHPHDVLCGRGGGTNHHVGNSHWRLLVASNKELYVTLPKKQKMLLSKSIVNAVRSQNPPGRFLQKNLETGLWYDVGDQRAQEKTSQALREGAPDVRIKVQGKIYIGSETPIAPCATTAKAETLKGVASSVPKVPASSTPAPYPKVAPPPSNSPHGAAPVHYACQKQPPAYTVPEVTPVPPPVLPPPVSAQGPVPERKSNKKSSQSKRHTMIDPNVEKLTWQQAKASVPNTVRTSSNPISESLATQTSELRVTCGFNFDSAAMAEAMSHDRRNKGDKKVARQTAEATYLYQGQRQSAHGGALPTVSGAAGNTSNLEHIESVHVEPPGSLDPSHEFSFGSIAMTDAEQARLENGFSIGSTMSYVKQSVDPPQSKPVVAAYQGVQNMHEEGHRTTGESSNTQLGGSSGLAHGAYHGVTDVSAAPIDSGLEPAGLSVGTMMSVGTETKLENIGTSFGSAMSYSVNDTADKVDGGLDAVGVSFGSLSLATTDRQELYEALQPMQPQVAPTFLRQQKSKGSLLECSDTDSDDEQQSAQTSAYKSLEWEKLKATVEAEQQSGYAAPSSGPAPMFLGGTPATLNIPATNFDRDVSQISTLSVPDARKDGDADFADMPPPPPPAKKEQSDDLSALEISLLNRGNSLASENFSVSYQPEANESYALGGYR